MLQGEFKAHQAVEKTRQTPIHPVEMKQEIATLEEEKKQLHQKIEKLKKQNEDVHDFPKLLQATNNLRLQQDEDVTSDNMRKQKVALQGAEQRKKDALKASTRSGRRRARARCQFARAAHGRSRHADAAREPRAPREIEAKREKLNA